MIPPPLSSIPADASGRAKPDHQPGSYANTEEGTAWPKSFKGVINLDIRDSTPDCDAFQPDKAPEGAPNVLVILYDNTGLAAWPPFGGRIEMPMLQRLADNGLIYSR